MTHFKTVSQVKAANKGYFFSRKTMRFFGDTMRSFGLKHLDGKTYLYRKPSSYVNAPFSGRVKASRRFFSCWEVLFDGNEANIVPVSDETKEIVYLNVAR